MKETTALDGTVLAYRVQGDGPTTVLVHGGFLDSRAWLALMPLLARSGRTVVAPDRRGHGESGPYGEHHRFAEDVDDLAVLVRELDRDRHGVEVFAHSAGCHVALAACAVAPISTLVLYEPPSFGDPAITASVWAQMDEAVSAGDRERLVILALNEVVGASTGERIPVPAFSSIVRTPFGQMLLDNSLSFPTELRALENHRWDETSLASLAIPIVVLVGSDSPLFNRRFADWLAGISPSAQVRELPQANHGTPMEDPACLAAILLEGAQLHEQTPLD